MVQLCLAQRETTWGLATCDAFWQCRMLLAKEVLFCPQSGLILHSAMSGSIMPCSLIQMHSISLASHESMGFYAAAGEWVGMKEPFSPAQLDPGGKFCAQDVLRSRDVAAGPLTAPPGPRCKALGSACPTLLYTPWMSSSFGLKIHTVVLLFALCL